MKVQDVIRKPLVTCDGDTTIDKVAELLDRHGVIAEEKRASKVRVKDVMAPHLITNDADLDEATRIFGTKQLRRILVTEDGKLVGILTARELFTRKPKTAKLFAACIPFKAAT